MTDVGMVPEDWDVVLLDSVTRRGSGHTPNKKRPNYWNGGIKWISLQDSHRLDRLYIRDTEASISRTGLANSSAVLHPAGTVVLSRDAGVGKSSIMWESMAVSQHFMAWNCGSDLVNIFLYYWLQFRKAEFERIAIGNTIKTIGLPYFKRLTVPLPSKSEQQAIAVALSDADALIESVEQLITKKRQVKQGAMEELLRPRETWIEKKLGCSASLKARIGWQGLTTGEYLKSGDYYLVTGTDFRNGYIAWDNCNFVDESRYRQDRHIQLLPGDILITKDGTIGKVALVDRLSKPATLNSGVFVLRPIQAAFHPAFLYYLLLSPVFTRFLAQLSAGSTISHLYQKDFVHFVYSTPPTLEEQTAIATILSEMDAEITGLEAKLTKARQVKQGMMQELLTGRIRLV